MPLCRYRSSRHGDAGLRRNAIQRWLGHGLGDRGRAIWRDLATMVTAVKATDAVQGENALARFSAINEALEAAPRTRRWPRDNWTSPALLVALNWRWMWTGMVRSLDKEQPERVTGS